MLPPWVIDADLRRKIGIGLVWVAAGALGVWAAAQGAKGAENVENASLVVALITLGVTVAGMMRKPQDERAAAEWRLPGMLIAALGIVVALAVGATLWMLIHKPDRNITDLVKLSGNTGMRFGGTADLVYDQPPERENLALTLTLENPHPGGNCVTPARMTVTPKVDGRALKAREAVSGQELPLQLYGAERRVEAQVLLTVPDPACVLDLRVSEAVLHN